MQASYPDKCRRAKWPRRRQGDARCSDAIRACPGWARLTAQDTVTRGGLWDRTTKDTKSTKKT